MCVSTINSNNPGHVTGGGNLCYACANSLKTSKQVYRYTVSQLFLFVFLFACFFFFSERIGLTANGRCCRCTYQWSVWIRVCIYWCLHGLMYTIFVFTCRTWRKQCWRYWNEKFWYVSTLVSGSVFSLGLRLERNTAYAWIMFSVRLWLYLFWTAWPCTLIQSPWFIIIIIYFCTHPHEPAPTATNTEVRQSWAKKTRSMDQQWSPARPRLGLASNVNQPDALFPWTKHVLNTKRNC